MTEPDASFCPTCGTRQVQGSTFCYKCGGRLPSELATGPTEVVRPSLPQRSGGNRTIWIAGVLIVALVAAAGFAVVQMQAAGSVRSELALARAELASMTADLASTNGQLGDEAAAHATTKDRVAELSRLLEGRASCVDALTANAIELDRLRAAGVENFNRSAKGSKLVTASVARDKYAATQTTDYFKAYQAAFDGRRSAANSWIDKGNAAVKKANAQTKIINAETKAINATTAQLATDSEALNDSIRQTGSTCGVDLSTQ